MKKIYSRCPRIFALTTVLILSSTFAFASGEVNATISAGDQIDVRIASVLPDSFPDISVIFDAADPQGYPFCNLQLDQLNVWEDGLPCSGISLEKLSKEIPINISIVLDHSESMLSDFHQYNPNSTPLDEAKAAIRTFTNQWTAGKDSLGLIAFGTEVTRRVSLRSDPSAVRYAVGKVEAIGSTAFYDALYESLVSLRNSGGIRAVVALTDGKDNNSKVSMDRVIRKAKQLDIPIFIIGLGNADRDPIRKITSASGGAAYYTKNSRELSKIYNQIEKKIRAVYKFVYRSENLKAARTRSVYIRFNVDSIFQTGGFEHFELPDDVLARLAEEQAELEAQRLADLPGKTIDEVRKPRIKPVYLAGGLAALFIGLGGLIAVRKRSSSVPLPAFSISSVHPNPANKIVQVQTSLDADAILRLVSSSGQEVFSKQVQSSTTTLDVSALPQGSYMLILEQEGQRAGARLSIVR